jgi:hypothetical protein
MLRFTVTNKAVASRRARALKRLKEIRERINANDYARLVASEGGTGIIKLRKLIGDTGESFTFGFDEDGNFTIQFVVLWPDRERSAA